MTAALGAAQGETAATAEDKLTCYTADVAVNSTTWRFTLERIKSKIKLAWKNGLYLNFLFSSTDNCFHKSSSFFMTWVAYKQ